MEDEERIFENIKMWSMCGCVCDDMNNPLVIIICCLILGEYYMSYKKKSSFYF